MLWVLWIWGEQEARHVADESGISRGTLTGVVTTLEKRGLVQRRAHPDDKRSVLVAATGRGECADGRSLPALQRRGGEGVGRTSPAGQKDRLADALRSILRTVERLDDD